MNSCLTNHLADALPLGVSVSQRFHTLSLKKAESIWVSALGMRKQAQIRNSWNIRTRRLLARSGARIALASSLALRSGALALSATFNKAGRGLLSWLLDNVCTACLFSLGSQSIDFAAPSTKASGGGLTKPQNFCWPRSGRMKRVCICSKPKL